MTNSLGPLRVSPDAYRATLKGEDLPLTATQLDVLAALVQNVDRVSTRSDLARAAGIENASVDVVLSALRRVLGDRFIRNVRNRGWIIEPSAFDI